MWRVRVPSTDWDLLLTPRWGELSVAAHAGVLALCLLVPLVLVLWLYRYEMRLVRPLTALGLLTLRLVVLLTLVLVVCLQPIVSRSTTEELQGRVLIAVDRSESMDVADPQRPKVDKLRLARALKIKVTKDLPSDAQLDDWIRQYQEKGEGAELQWVGADENPKDPERRRRLAEERRALHDTLCRQVNQLTRSQIAQRILSREGARLLTAVADKHHVELLGFHEESWDVQPEQADELFRPPSAPTGPPTIADQQPTAEKGPRSKGQRTDLSLPLARALERSGKEEGKVLGVVLLTDGQHNWRPSPVAKAVELGEQGLPVFPVALGARQAPPAVAVVGIRAQPAVFKDVDLPVEARFKVSGLPAQDFIVELKGTGEELKEEVHHAGKDRYYTVRFQARMSKPGTQALTVSVRPKAGTVFDDQGRPVPGKVRFDNNNRAVEINVADDKAKVLLVDGEARWEYHYLANALVRDRTVQTQSVVFTQPRLGKIAEDELRRIGNPALTLPSDPDALAPYDCIVLGDVSPTQLPLAERARLEKYVADRGGTLVILAGKRSMPLAYQEFGAVAPTRPDDPESGDPLIRLLPVVQPQAVSFPKGFPVTLTQEGKLASFLQMDPMPHKNLERWAELPRHFWGMVGRAKPGAIPLAYLPEQEAPPEKKQAGERDKEPERERALIVRQNYGFGRVLFVGLDSTWRWRYQVGDTYHHRFWGQVVRWAASDKPLVGGNEHVRFGTRDAVYREKQEVTVVVRLQEDVPVLGPGAIAGARVLRVGDDGKEEAVALLPLTRKGANPRLLEGQARDLPSGEYHIELAIPDLADKLQGPAGPDGKPGKLQTTFNVLPSDSQEMIELATNWPLLEELASKSGGNRVFTAENAPELVDLLTRRVIIHEESTERRVWQEWWILAFFLVLLTVEWVGRKLAGLP
jgi:hypothetical protein